MKEYLEEELNVINDEIKNVNKRYDRKDLLSLLGIVFFTTLGGFTVFTMPLYGAALFGGALGSLEASLSNKKRMKEELSRLEREKNHIKKIATNGLDTSREMTEKRIKKVNQLIAENNKMKSSYNAWRGANNVALAGLGISMGVAAFFPPIGLAAAAVTTVAKLITGNKLTKSHESLQINKNRLNNLITDVNTIKLASKSSRPKKVAKQPTQTSKAKTNSKQVQRSKKAQSSHAVQNGRQVQNAEAVQRYIDSLAREQSQPSKPKQKSKY